MFQSTHSLRSATKSGGWRLPDIKFQSTHSLRSATGDVFIVPRLFQSFNPRTPCGVRRGCLSLGPGGIRFQSTHSLRSATLINQAKRYTKQFQSTHSLRSATAPDLIHCNSTEQIILCANLPKKTVIARLLFLSIYLSIFYSNALHQSPTCRGVRVSLRLAHRPCSTVFK